MKKLFTLFACASLAFTLSAQDSSQPAGSWYLGSGDATSMLNIFSSGVDMHATVGYAVADDIVLTAKSTFGGEFIMINASCPVDNKNSTLRWSMRVTKDIEDELGMAIIDGIANGVLDDMPIWDHKSYVAQPILCDGDGPINKFRKWVSQFYSDPLQAS